ncbi:proliferation associated protein [Heterostelium album PN500]|uniref:Proliferation associated protein n=1 Tax=Heterostelium pallidum (strain ATCC 26659 / Pp 5 / PN500) TaxID=670386 RepID=D3B264_HETP5|nr:proliferation associated protein [Heterostelium album PN500]EFA84439.1 proliferation associated protein [Heterostelium album PN500]|eukprot:XP_020436553.1 proliferation associated protein [Heterostelium album PN500]
MSKMQHDHHSEDEDENIVEDLTSPWVVTCYQSAALIANKALKEVIAKCVEGAVIVDVCAAGDDFIEKEVAKTFNKRKGLEKGIAFPTSVSVNNCVGHFSPLKGDTRTLKNGDVAKIDLGVHIDGYISLGAFTVIVGGAAAPLTGKAADAICAAHFALECALRLIKKGNKASDVTDCITKICDTFHVNAVQGILSHDLKRFLLDGDKVIFNKMPVGQKIEDAVFEENEVYCIDIVVSTAEGKVRELNDRTTIFKRDVNQNYNLKLKSAREFIQEVNTRFPALPFSLRAVSDEKKAKLGLSECLTHQMLNAFPVLYEKDGEFVVQFKTTVLLLPSGNQKLTCTDIPLPHVNSAYSLDEVTKEIATRPLKREKKAAAKTSNAMDTTN